MRSNGKLHSKREKVVQRHLQLSLPLARAEDQQFQQGLLNLSLAVIRDQGQAAPITSRPNGLPIALDALSGVAGHQPDRPLVPDRFADASVREGSVEPHFGRKKDGAMAARAAATAMARKAARRQPASSASRRAETKLERRDRVVMEHLSLVKAIAIRVHEGLPVHVELDDLVHAGILGLFDAASKYNPGKHVAFSSYAKHRVKGAILDSLRQMDWASRDLRRRHKQVEQITRDLCATLQRQPTEDELAEKMGVGVSRWRQMALDLRNVGLVSASSRGKDQDELPPPEYPGTPDTQPDHMCAREQMRQSLETAMSVLPERYKKVVVLYYSNEMTMKEIGGLLGINESRVSQIHKSALEKMAVALQESGITSVRAF